LEEAKAYWGEHFAGKTLNLAVHKGKGANKRKIPIRVRFDAKNDHAFTDDVGGKQKTGERKFDASRAQAMHRILSVIEHPKKIARHYGADLLFESSIKGRHFTVVLAWRESDKVYEFNSAYFMDVGEVSYLLEHQDRGKGNGPLWKSEPLDTGPSVIKSLLRRELPHRRPTADESEAPARNRTGSVAKMLLVCKSRLTL